MRAKMGNGLCSMCFYQRQKNKKKSSRYFLQIFQRYPKIQVLNLGEIDKNMKVSKKTKWMVTSVTLLWTAIQSWVYIWSCRKVMFSVMSICHSVRGEGVPYRVTYHMMHVLCLPWWTNKRLWKQNLPATSFAGVESSEIFRSSTC